MESAPYPALPTSWIPISARLDQHASRSKIRGRSNSPSNSISKLRVARRAFGAPLDQIAVAPPIWYTKGHFGKSAVPPGHPYRLRVSSTPEHRPVLKSSNDLQEVLDSGSVRACCGAVSAAGEKQGRLGPRRPSRVPTPTCGVLLQFGSIPGGSSGAGSSAQAGPGELRS